MSELLKMAFLKTVTSCFFLQVGVPNVWAFNLFLCEGCYANANYVNIHFVARQRKSIMNPQLVHGYENISPQTNAKVSSLYRTVIQKDKRFVRYDHNTDSNMLIVLNFRLRDTEALQLCRRYPDVTGVERQNTGTTGNYRHITFQSLKLYF